MIDNRNEILAAEWETMKEIGPGEVGKLDFNDTFN